MKGQEKGCLGGGKGELYSIFFKKNIFFRIFFWSLGF